MTAISVVPAADIDDHVAHGLVDVQSDADRGGHRFGHQADLLRARPLTGVLHRALFDLRDATGDAYDHVADARQPIAFNLLQHALDHLLRDLKVSDNAVLERPDGLDLRVGAFMHLERLVADLSNLARLLVDGDNARLVEHDAFAPDVDQRVGCSEIDGNVLREVKKHLCPYRHVCDKRMEARLGDVPCGRRPSGPRRGVHMRVQNARVLQRAPLKTQGVKTIKTSYVGKRRSVTRRFVTRRYAQALRAKDTARGVRKTRPRTGVFEGIPSGMCSAPTTYARVDYARVDYARVDYARVDYARVEGLRRT